MIKQLIVNKILEARRAKKTIVVAFCGAADLGKTYVAKAVVQLLNSYEISSAHLGLDSFLMDRSERKSRGISGYDPKAHDIRQIVGTLSNWRAAKTIKYYAYDHQAGEKTKDYTLINDCEVLLIEGLFALHESILPFVELSFFFYTNDEILQQIKLAADLVKRGYTPEYSRKIYQAEFELYKQHIETMSEKANYRLFLQDKWQYLIEEGQGEQLIQEDTVYSRGKKFEMFGKGSEFKYQEIEFRGQFTTRDPLSQILSQYDIETSRTRWARPPGVSETIRYNEQITFTREDERMRVQFAQGRVDRLCRYYDYFDGRYLYGYLPGISNGTYFYIDPEKREIEMSSSIGGLGSGTIYRTKFNY